MKPQQYKPRTPALNEKAEWRAVGAIGATTFALVGLAMGSYGLNDRGEMVRDQFLHSSVIETLVDTYQNLTQ